MQKKKLPRDSNSLAARIVAITTGVEEPDLGTKPKDEATPEKNNPAAVAQGRLGGLKGGRARAEKLSAEKRAHIAQKAARARWAKRD